MPGCTILGAMQIASNVKRILTSLTWCGVTMSIVACGSKTPEPPVVEMLTVSIDAGNNCSMEREPVECSQVATVIRKRFPTSKPRVDICLDRQTRYEAAAEVMQSVSAAGFTVGKFHCGKPPTAG